MRSRGLFIVIEGSDGSGKTTQFNLLKERLKATGYEVTVFDFPRYDQGSSYFVRRYLNGDYGPASEISPYTASLFYALDRFEAAKDIKKALDQGKIVLSNRYVGSNMAHQGGKFIDPVEQRGFFVWEDNLEFELLKIPRPDINFFLRVPAEVSHELIGKKSAREYTNKSHDQHEGDLNHLKKAVATYDLLCQLFPKDFKAIECTKNGRILEIAKINNLIWEVLQPTLPAERPNPSHSVVVTLGAEENANKSIGDESSDELSLPLKNASLLLRLQVERHNPSSVTNTFRGWDSSDYAFYTPSRLPRELTSTYKTALESMANIHKSLGRKLDEYLEKTNNTAQATAKLLLPLTPLSALSEFNIELKKQELESLSSSLLAQNIDEAQWAAKQLYLAAHQKWPADFKQAIAPTGGPESINSIIAKLADERLPNNNSSSDGMKLLEARPRQEFDLLAESIYPFSSLSLEEITEEVSSWPYQQKYESLEQAVAQPGLLRKVRYKMDIVSDQLALNELAEAAQLKQVQVQAFTPRYGFDVPAIIEEAGLDDLYNQCFDDSLKLYSLLQGAGRDDLAPYATLMGHKVRWQLSTSAEYLHKALQNSEASAYKTAAEDILEKISEAHPLLWEIIGKSEASAAARPKPHKKPLKPSRQRTNREQQP